MAHQRSPRFLEIVTDAKKRIQEVTLDEVKAKLQEGEQFVLIDVREESEFAKDHIPGALHMGKGTIERDIEQKVPDLNTPIGGQPSLSNSRQIAERTRTLRANFAPSFLPPSPR